MDKSDITSIVTLIGSAIAMVFFILVFYYSSNSLNNVNNSLPIFIYLVYLIS